jgi:hypothetical protein
VIIKTSNDVERADNAKPAEPTIDPAMHTVRHPNLFVNADTIGPKL